MNIPEYKIVAVRQAPLPSEMIQMTSNKQAYEYWRDVIKTGPNYREDIEQLYVIMLNESARVLGHALVSMGTSDMTLARAKEVLRPVLLANASSFILVHNHPNNDTHVSEPDRQSTSQIGVSADIMGVRLLDHIVVGEVDPLVNPNGYSSVAESVEEKMKTNPLAIAFFDELKKAWQARKEDKAEFFDELKKAVKARKEDKAEPVPA